MSVVPTAVQGQLKVTIDALANSIKQATLQARQAQQAIQPVTMEVEPANVGDGAALGGVDLRGAGTALGGASDARGSTTFIPQLGTIRCSQSLSV